VLSEAASCCSFSILWCCVTDSKVIMSCPGLGRHAERGGLRVRDWMDAKLHIWDWACRGWQHPISRPGGRWGSLLIIIACLWLIHIMSLYREAYLMPKQAG
jgi:hypothetical protein